MFIYFWETERQREKSVSGGGVEREGDTESEAGPGSELSAQRLTRGSNSREPMNREIMTWTEAGRLTDWATQVPLPRTINWLFWYVINPPIPQFICEAFFSTY